MAYRYPPPPIGKMSEQTAPPFTPVMNFNIPPPGFRPNYSSEAFQHHPPPHSSSPVQESLDPFGKANSRPPTEKIASTTEIIPHAPHWLLDWLQNRNIHHEHKPKEGTPQLLKVYEVRQILQKCLSDLDKLHELQENLKSSYHNLSPKLWREKWELVNDLKFQIKYSLEKLNNPVTLHSVRKLLLKRSKKRKREKRKRGEHKEIMAEFHAKRQHIHESIDKWLKDMQEVVERAKREESLKHEADQVLSEVTRRKAEARRQLNMLRSLQKLRRIRAHTAAYRGQQVNIDSGIRFARVVEHLLKLWEDQMKDYEVEEQGLRVMLEEAVEERTKSEVSQMKQSLQQWEVLLFGKRGSYNDFYQAAEQDIESFIAVRNSWDKFLAPPGAAMSSSIPFGWVLPSHPSSEQWETLLAKDK